MKLIILILSFVLCSGVFAKTPDSFAKRFKLIKKDGKVVAIKDTTLTLKFELSPYINFVRDRLLNEQFMMSAKGHYEERIEELLLNDYGQTAMSYQSGKTPQERQNLGKTIESLREIGKLDVGRIFENTNFQDVLKKFEDKVNEILVSIDPSVVAKLDDSTFYYKKKVVHQVVVWALNYARKKLTNIPLLNTASFMIVQVEKMIRDRRLFHQNMLLHYLENYPEADLGLTKEEADLAFSSIYESRIPWFNNWESKNAQRYWRTYGTGKFFKYVRTANTQLRMSKQKYDRIDERINFAFQKASFNGRSVILNIFYKDNMFSQDFAIAYDYDDPSFVAKRRATLQLAELGLSFLSLPSWIKDNVEKYIKSFYYNQALTEGALHGYFESTGDKYMTETVIINQMNPFQK